MAARRLYSLDDCLTAHLLAAYQAGDKLAQFRIGPYAFSFWMNLITGESSILLYRYTRSGGAALGKIQNNKLYPNGGFNRDRDLEAIKKFMRYPKQAAAAAAFAADQPVCACCRRRLGQSDRSRGIGQSCWEKWKF